MSNMQNNFGKGRGRGRGRGPPGQQNSRPGNNFARQNLNLENDFPSLQASMQPNVPGPSQRLQFADCYREVRHVRSSSPCSTSSTHSTDSGRGSNAASSDGYPASTESMSDNRPRMQPQSSKSAASNASASSAVEHLQDAFKMCSVRDQPEFQFAVRPDFGQAGIKHTLHSNLFHLNFDPKVMVNMYDVDISCRRGTIKRAKNRKAIAELARQHPQIFKDSYLAYDGEKILYTLKNLSGMPLTEELTVDIDGKKETYCIKIQWVSTIPFKDIYDYLIKKLNVVPQHALSALNIILRELPSQEMISVGRSFFHFPENINKNDMCSLGRGASLYFGFHQNVMPTLSEGMVLNIDMSTLAFYDPDPVIVFVQNLFERRLGPNDRLRPEEVRSLDRHLKTLIVETVHMENNRKFKVFGISKKNSKELNFTQEQDGKSISVSVARYFSKQYGITLKYPLLPCLEAGSREKPIYIPMEVCKIKPGQEYRLLDAKQKADMIKMAACRPAERFDNIRQNLHQCRNINKPYLDKYGLSVDDKNIAVEGRTINAPSVIYGPVNRPKHLKPRDGQWDIKNQVFINPANVGNWGLVSFVDPRRCGSDAVEKLRSMLMSMGRDKGMNMGQCFFKQCNPRVQSVSSVLENLRAEVPGIKMIVCIIPGEKGAGDVHAQLKTTFDAKKGIATQCILDTNVARKLSPAMVQGLLLQINVKSGGTNSVTSLAQEVALFQNDVIVIGADVIHPSPGGAEGGYSISAAVGTVSQNYTRYAAQVRMQNLAVSVRGGRTTIRDREIIWDLKDMVKNLLIKYYQKMGKKKPAHIIFYRDGVSDGQMPAVFNNELQAVKQCFVDLEKNGSYNPKVTFIIVKKRHHTKFLNPNRNGSNMEPGTVVDKGIVHPRNFDFFLCSHKGIQGTSRPVHYTVLHDENNFTSDELQKVTHYFTHSYSPATKSIAIPTPVRYADAAAYRAKTFMTQNNITCREEVTKELLDEIVESLHFTE